MLDLVVLAAGADERETLRALLGERSNSLGIRRVDAHYRVHAHRDAGCFNEAAELLAGYRRRARYALVVFDREGSGQEERSATAIEDEPSDRLRQSGWDDRAGVVVIDPELEIWIWADSDAVSRTLGWPHAFEHLRRWLRMRGRWTRGTPKPTQPKECLELTLAQTHKRRSPELYGELGRRVGLKHCQDPAFQRLRAILRGWFPPSGKSRSP